MKFKERHDQQTPILICNVWDVISAKKAEQLNYQAIGTSSGAIASMLGYQDGEEMSFQELEYMVKRIVKSVNIPLSVDLEAGYSRNPNTIVEHICRLVDLGVVGINIEDSLVEGNRNIVDADIFSRRLDKICASLTQKNIELFINIRTDTFLLGVSNPVFETIQRSEKYLSAGADGLFVPCIETSHDIESVVKEINLPLNVMCMPNLPSFKELKRLGVSRISMGNFVYEKMNKDLGNQLNLILKEQSFKSLFG